PHDAAPRRNVPLLQAFRLGIEPHDRVWIDTRFAVPHRPVTARGNTVRSRIRTAWRFELLDLFGLRIESPQETSLVIRVPNDIVSGNRDAARPRARRQRVFRNRHGLWIDAANLVGTEHVKERHPG